MPCHRHLFWILIAALAFAAIPPVAFADEEVEAGRRDNREEFESTYLTLRTDPQHQALVDQLDGRTDDRAAVDRYLSYLPISPLDLYELDKEFHHYELFVPAFIQRWHVRWLELHESKARELYGDDYVDGQLDKGAAEGDSASVNPLEALTKMASVATNRNAAFNFVPPPNLYQGEIQVAVNPNNRNQIVAAANTWGNIPGICRGNTQAIFYSADGGVSWGYTCAPDDTAYAALPFCNNILFGSDPAVTWNTNNEVFLEHMMLCTITGASSNTQYSIVVARSTDGGQTWGSHGVVKSNWPTPGIIEDKNFYAIDKNPGSPFVGRHYTCWDRNNNEKSAYSTDNGVTWTEVNLPTTPSTGSGSPADLACELAVQKDGTVHVIYDTLRCGAFNCTNEQMFHSRSTNGGLSWSPPVLVRDFNLVGFSGANCPAAQNQRCINPFGSIDVDNTGGACDGTLYATFTDFTSGGANNSDVWVSRSTNNGANWSSPVKVNDDPLTNRIQFHPFLAVDPFTGFPAVAWHDARNDSLNRAVDFYAARSTDCGLTFEANIKASAPSPEFNNSTISFSNESSFSNPNFNPNQYGEYLGLDHQAGKAFIAWTDTRQFFPAFTTNPQDENVGFTVVDFTGPYIFSGAVPGTAGVNNTWSVSGGTPTQTTFFIFGLTAGSIQIPGCPAGTTVGIADINVLSSPLADSAGNASYQLFIPANLAGLTVLFQAIELSTCTVSPVFSTTF